MKLRGILAVALALACGPALAQVNPGTQPLSIAKGGTAGATAAAAWANLVQPPSATTLGGIKSLTCSASNWFNTLSTAGALGCSQPNFTDLAGSLALAQIPASLITYAKIQNVTASRILGNPTGSAAAPSEISIGASLAFSGTALQTNAFTGDVTTAANSFATTIAANAVTYAKMQTVTAQRLLGNPTGGAAVPSEISLPASLTFSGTALQTSAFTGDVTTSANSFATTIAANAVTNAKMATMAANTVKGNATGGSATPTDVTPATARSSSLLNVDSFTGHGDSIYTILSTDRTVGTNAAFTASRTWTLPAANAVNAGQEIVVADFQGTVTGTNTLVVSRAGADTINGGTTATISAANGGLLLRSDGVSKWTAQAFTAGSGVTSITAGQGLSGGTITTSGTIAINLTTASNVLGADVLLNNTGSTFDGPSMAQGTSGTWKVTGSVAVSDTAGAPNIKCKLWDGTTVISSGLAQVPSTGGFNQITLAGFLTSPAANIKVSCTDTATTTGVIKFNASGFSKDSWIFGERIN
jgi:hypothetical protein